jgi:putative oxidoreductase
MLDLVQRWSEKLRWFPPLLARVTLFGIFAPTGWGKLHSLEKVTDFFTSLGIPHPHFNAVLVAATEMVGGSLLLVGLLSRAATVPLIVSMAVAIATAKRENLEGVLDVLGLEEFVYIVLLVGILVSGPGAVALDRLAARRLQGDRK